MYPYHRWQRISVLPQDLIAFAWSAPMRDLAARIGISDVGLRKLLKAHGVVLPPQGHWNRVHAGRKVPGPPKAPPRRPGETGRLEVDRRFAPFVAQATPLASSGPFASRDVPEDLEELRTRELKALGRVAVPRTLEMVHPGLKGIIEKESRLREKAAQSSWYWDEPLFDGPLDQRRLRLLNGLFLALAKRGHGGDASTEEHEIHPRAVIGNTSMGLTLEIAGKHRQIMQHGRRRPDPGLPAHTPLILKLRPGFDREVEAVWQDDADGRLEPKLAAIVAGLIVAGEALFRRRLKVDEDRVERERIEREAEAERKRIEREQRRIAKLEKLNRQRVDDLRRSGELLRLSRDVRTLVEKVRTAMAGRTDIAAETVADWERWALDEADRLDPILSGQFLTHLHPPVLAPED